MARKYELFFTPRSPKGRELRFPCSVAGNVDIDALSDAARIDYLFARTVVGRDVAAGQVRTVDEPDTDAPRRRN